MGAMVFEINLFAIGIGMTSQWWYATTEGRSTESALKPSYVKRVLMGNLVVPTNFGHCIFFAMTGFPVESTLYMTLPVVDYLVGRHIWMNRDKVVVSSLFSSKSI